VTRERELQNRHNYPPKGAHNPRNSKIRLKRTPKVDVTTPTTLARNRRQLFSWFAAFSKCERDPTTKIYARDKKSLNLRK